jgi:hypothetical protein
VRLPDPQRSYAVLIGTSTYHFPELADLPAVHRNLGALAGVLTDQALGWLPAERCIVLSDPTDVRVVYRTLRQYAAIAEDTLLVYFAGHGRTGPRNELYLGLTDTNPDELRVSALPFDLIREVLSDSPATNRVLILDCCFSGRAIQDMSGPDEAILGQIGIEGTYTLTSAPANVVALAPIGAEYTAFTGELITLLRTGIPNGPELLTFATLYPQLLYTMTILGLPLPRQRGTGTVDQLALTRNPARHPGQAPAPLSQRTGASSQVHTDTATSHHAWSRQSVPDGLYIQGKKTLPAAILLIMIAGEILSLTGVLQLWLVANDPVGNGQGSWILFFVLFLPILTPCLFVMTVPTLRFVLRPFDLRIDPRGIELNSEGCHTSYLWKEIDSITVRRISWSSEPSWLSGGHGIYVYPLPGAPPPPRSLNFPRPEENTGWILIASLRCLFNVPRTEIETSLARFAGSRWNPAE